MNKAIPRALLVLALWFGIAMVLTPMPAGIAHADSIVCDDGNGGIQTTGDPDLPDVKPPTKSSNVIGSGGWSIGMGVLRPTSQTPVVTETGQSFRSGPWLDTVLWTFRLYFGW